MGRQKMGFEYREPSEPFKGLRPYEEEDGDRFYGRQEERDIVIDKIISHKLTFLFSAAGVGKSSLLKAAVIPKLKLPEEESLDVIYYNDWVSVPMEQLKKETLRVLIEGQKIAGDFQVKEGLPLDEFFLICSTFSSKPMVIILDQFEEFFQYYRDSHQFPRYLEEFSKCFLDKRIHAVFLISMREDFALELTAFKRYLSTTLFSNFYRLEKLTVKKAEEAIIKPVEQMDFRYEEKLVDDILKGLSCTEKESRAGKMLESLSIDAPSFVDPPNLQIVCSWLWENREADNRIIKRDDFIKKGRVDGILDSYFKDLMDRFKSRKKRIASKAFGYLVTPRGSKISYPVKDLGDILRIKEDEMRKVLELLEKNRVLRGQIRRDETSKDKKGEEKLIKKEMWYELYHDVFSDIIRKWNKEFITRQRIRKIFRYAGAIVLFLGVIVVYLLFDSPSYYLISGEEGAGRVEFHMSDGKILKKKYKAETVYRQHQFDPDKEFKQYEIADYRDINDDLIGRFPNVKRIPVYWEAGKIQKALGLADRLISGNNIERSKQVIDLLAGFGSAESYKILKDHLDSTDNIKIRRHIIQMLGEMESPRVINDLIGLLESKDADVRQSAADALGRIGNSEAVEPLIHILEDTNQENSVRTSAVTALGRIGSTDAVEPLISVLKNKSEVRRIRFGAVTALSRINGAGATAALVGVLKDRDSKVRFMAVEALSFIGDDTAVRPLLNAAMDNDEFVRLKAVEALGYIGRDEAVEPLISILKDRSRERTMQSYAAHALGRIGSIEAVGPLLNVLKDTGRAVDVRTSAITALGSIDKGIALETLPHLVGDKTQARYVRIRAISVLGEIGDYRAANPIIHVLKDEKKDRTLRRNAVEALGRIGGVKAVEPLIDALDDQDKDVKRGAAQALGLIAGAEAVEPLLEALKDQDKNVKRGAAEALGLIGSTEAVEPLMVALKEKDPAVQRPAAYALGRIGSPEAVKALVGAFKERQGYMRYFAEKALDVLGSVKTEKPLVNVLNGQDSEVRSLAAEALRQTGSAGAVEPLIDVLKDVMQGSFMRITAAYSLGSMDSNRALDALIWALKDSDWEVRLTAVESLGKHGNHRAAKPVTLLLNDPYSSIRRSALLCLGKLGAKDKAPLFKKVFDDPKENPGVRIAAAAVLLKFGDETGLGYLEEKFRSTKPGERIAAARVFKEVPSKKGTSLLLKALTGKNVNVQKQVIASLGNQANKFAVPQLHKLMKQAGPGIKYAIVESLGDIASLNSTGVLKQTAMNREEHIQTRLMAVTALGGIGNNEAANAMLDTLNTGEEVIEIKTLVEIGNIKSLQSLSNEVLDRLKRRLKKKLEILEERKERWRGIRDEKTGTYNDKEMENRRRRLSTFKPDESMEMQLAFNLSRLDPRGEGTALLSHHLANVRRGAWMAIGKTMDAGLIEKLYEINNKSNLPWLRHAAYRAMDNILINIETFGGKEELKKLEEIYTVLSDSKGETFHAGVQTRMKWTIDRLKVQVMR
jgi:HEAT repeat protein